MVVEKCEIGGENKAILDSGRVMSPHRNPVWEKGGVLVNYIEPPYGSIQCNRGREGLIPP